jgi:hypothetical protein
MLCFIKTPFSEAPLVFGRLLSVRYAQHITVRVIEPCDAHRCPGNGQYAEFILLEGRVGVERHALFAQSFYGGCHIWNVEAKYDVLVRFEICNGRDAESDSTDIEKRQPSCLLMSL